MSGDCRDYAVFCPREGVDCIRVDGYLGCYPYVSVPVRGWIASKSKKKPKKETTVSVPVRGWIASQHNDFNGKDQGFRPREGVDCIN